MTRLSQPCKVLTILLQGCDKVVTRLSLPCGHLVISVWVEGVANVCVGADEAWKHSCADAFDIYVYREIPPNNKKTELKIHCKN